MKVLKIKKNLEAVRAVVCGRILDCWCWDSLAIFAVAAVVRSTHSPNIGSPTMLILGMLPVHVLVEPFLVSVCKGAVGTLNCALFSMEHLDVPDAPFVEVKYVGALRTSKLGFTLHLYHLHS